MTAIAAFVDMQRQESLGRIYQGAFAVGCVLAVCLARRRSLFSPVVQPPLVFAFTAIAAVTLLGPKTSGGLKSLLLSVALPLTSNFPTMGITTAVVVAIGVYRWWRERDPNPHTRPNRPARERAVREDDVALAEQPGQGTGGRGLRDRPVAEPPAAPAAPARRGRPEPGGAPVDERSGRRVPGRGPRPSREPGAADAGREGAREPRRRDAAARGDRGRAEPPVDGARGRGRGAEPPPRRREPGEGSGPRDDRGRREAGREGGRDAGRDAGREGRGESDRPRRRPPESYR
nr:DUF6542 domain-containing protein [Actinophytocola oryzae]